MTKFTEQSIPDVSDKTIVITGANSGIGYEASVMLLARGARLVIGCRNATKAEHAMQLMVEDANVDKSMVHFIPLDLADLDSVSAFSEALHNAYDHIDVLINNAGIMAVDKRKTTKQGFELQMGTNHFGPFALTSKLMDLLENSPSPRVVTVSSGAHPLARSLNFNDMDCEKSYNKWMVYCRTKLCNILFTRALAQRLEENNSKILAVACHPGYSATNLQNGTAFAALNKCAAQSSRMGALPTMMAATAPNLQPGSYYGPSFMFGWRGYPTHVPRQMSSVALNDDLANALWEFSEQRVGRMSIK